MPDKKPKPPEAPKGGLIKRMNSYTLKALGITALLILFLIPLSMIGSLLSEREYRRSEVENEVLYSWGGVTTVAGPILQLPYIDSVKRNYVTDEGEKKSYIEEVPGNLFLIPQRNEIDLTLSGEERTRAIYTIPLYQAVFSMEGKFDLTILEDYTHENRRFLYDESRVLLSASDISGLSRISDLSWDGGSASFKPDPRSDLLSDQIAARIKLDSTQNEYPFHLDFSLQGGRSLHILPTAEQFKLQLDANWSGLSFIGKFLPAEHQQEENSFQALWQINYLSAGVPSAWNSADALDLNLQGSSFGIAMVDRVSVYLKNSRAQKYGILFLLIPFLTFFMFEVISGVSIHPVQYLLAGAADIVFYLLLLSVSEHLDFNRAYAIASLGVTLLLSLYSLSVFKGKGKGWIMPLILVLSYFYLFNVLQSEDYALLMGSIGLFGILAVVMLLTRKVDWNSGNKGIIEKREE